MRTLITVCGALGLAALAGVGWFTLVGNGQVWLATLGAIAVCAAFAFNAEKKGK